MRGAAAASAAARVRIGDVDVLGLDAAAAARAARPHGRLHRAERGGVVQPLAHDPRPGRRAGAPPRHDAARRGGAEGDRAVPRARAARSGDDRRALPAPGLGRPAAAADGGDGADHRPRGRHPRRADDRARRDDADRGAARVPPRRARAQGHGGLREPRPGGRRADGRPHPGAARRPHARAERHRATAHGAGRTTTRRACSPRRGRRSRDVRPGRVPTAELLLEVRGLSAGYGPRGCATAGRRR